MEWTSCSLTFIYMIFLSFDSNMQTLAIEVDGNSDNCVISVVIPRDSVKSSCSASSRNEFKLRSVEGIISQLRREINDIKVKLAYTLSPKPDSKEVEDLIEKVNSLENDEIISIQKRLSIIENRFDTLDNTKKLDNDLTISKKPTSTFLKNLSRKKLSKIVKTIVKKELSGLEDKIKESLIDEIQLEGVLSLGAMSHKGLQGETSTANAQSNMLYRQYNQQESPQQQESSLNLPGLKNEDILSKGDGVLPKIARNAKDNEFPNVRAKTDIIQTQSDSDFGNGMSKLFEIFRSELTDSLTRQTQRVKDITTQHLSSIEGKMARLVRVIEGMKNKYDKKFVPQHENNEKLRGKIQALENHISTLAQGIASMKENLFSDRIMEERFMQQQLEIENKITSKLYKSDLPSKRELENLEVRLKEANKKVDITDANFKNYRADMRIRTLFLEQNITRLVNTITHLNETILFPDYEDAANVDEMHRNMEVNRAVKFVKEIREIWPTIVHNITDKDLMDEIDREDIDLELKSVQALISDLNGKDEQIHKQISSMNYSISSITDRISDIEIFNLKTALEHNKWVRYNFNCSYGRSSCFGGKKYVRKTTYSKAEFVGVVLCSEHRYKIFLSDSLDSTFLDLGDTLRGGEDHCEFVGALKGSNITVGRGEPNFDNIRGYKRSDWGQNPIKGTLSFYTPIPPWYECGVTIP